MLALAAILLSTLVSGFGPPTLGNGDPYGPRFTQADVASLEALPTTPATVRALAAIVIDGADGNTLGAKNADARLAPASLTKMMTALVALERGALTDTITATERSRSEPTTIGLDPGDTLALEDALYGLLLNSGNDAALAIAESVGGGSIERFVGWMNERAAAMGLANTRFMNPNGLDQAGHYSSARDMAEIARHVMATPVLARVVGSRRHTVTGPPLYGFFNTNPLLGFAPDVDGIKTGFTDDAGRCFAASATRDGRRVITVVLNSPNVPGESLTLLESGFAQARRVQIDVPRAGFAGVRDLGVSATHGAPGMALVGWEAPFLRSYTTTGGGASETQFALLGRPLSRWVS